jgi:putative DNA-invertase from lambdoid prophage Rac
MAIYGYARVSTAKQVNEGESLDVQRRQIEGYALMHGLVLTDTFIEEGVSGSIPVTDRPQGSLLFATLAKGDSIIAPKLDRVFRSALDALQTVETLKAKGVSLHLLDLGGDISGNGLSKLFLTIAAAFAEAERDRIRERVSQTKADQKSRGRFLGGSVPFGYRAVPIDLKSSELVPHEEQQEAIREMIALKAQGKSLRAIAAVMILKGHSITHATVAAILRQAKS